MLSAEQRRLDEARQGKFPWKKWGPYLSERQWGTVREDYSEGGDAWNFFTHDQARARAYRWGEDGLAGVSDDHQLLCLSLALWNGRDPILKERMFGLTNSEANHGEDVKEYYFYLDSTPTHSYMKYLYKYPQAEYPYAQLLKEALNRGKDQAEFELIDTGIFNENRYFDTFIEYAKADCDDILIKLSAINRGPDAAPINLLPTVWFRNTWSWDFGTTKPELHRVSRDTAVIELNEEQYGRRYLYCEGAPELLFTENETNTERLFDVPNTSGFAKDGINNLIVNGQLSAVNKSQSGTKAAANYAMTIEPGQTVTIRLRLTDRELNANGPNTFLSDFDEIFDSRINEADEFYDHV